jgi:sulfotransferase
LDKKFHFITGLPRSGSTLLSAILNQNPRFSASITDTLAPMVKGVIEASQDGPGSKYLVPESRRLNLVRGLVKSFYQEIDRPVIFNTNRAWTLLTAQVNMVFPKSKIIVCVRDIAWVLDSFERAHRKYPLNTNTATGGLGPSVYDRCENLLSPQGIVGFAYSGIKQAITSDEQHKIMLIEYDALCQQPGMVLESLYNFIEEPVFIHDFDNCESHWDEYDREIGIPLHKIRKKVEMVPRKFILPPDLITSVSNMEVWRK